MDIKAEKIEIVSVDSLIPHEKNMHNHEDSQIERLVKLIEYQGMRNPIIVQAGTNKIVAGHGRLMAMKKMGVKECPVIYQEFDSEAQLYAYMVSDNAIGKDTWATLDLSKINSEMLDLGPDFDIDLMGIKDFVVEPIEKFEPQTDEDAVPEVIHPITRKGDIWLLGSHRLMCGDSTMIDDVEKLMNGEKADMVFTDPPYRVISGGTGSEIFKGTSLEKNDGKIFKHNDLDIRDMMPILELVTVDKCQMYVMVNFLNLSNYLNIIAENFDIHNLLIWKKKVGLPSQYYCKNIEYTIFFRKGNAFPINNAGSRICEEFEHDKDKVHPTQKPVSLVSHYIGNSSSESQIVLEPFLGSGSTLIACEKTNRKCFGMELDEKYCDVIIKRWQNYTGKKATLELTGQTYEELKQERDASSSDGI